MKKNKKYGNVCIDVEKIDHKYNSALKDMINNNFLYNYHNNVYFYDDWKIENNIVELMHKHCDNVTKTKFTDVKEYAKNGFK